jgi:lipoprotein-anchoring transpeptidase ErfK/SrfK
VRSKSSLAILIPLSVVVLVIAGLGIYDYTKKDTVAEGVTVSGVDVGGLDRDQAAAKLKAELLPELAKPVTVEIDGKQFVLGPRESRIAVDIDGTVDEAVAAGRTSVFPVRSVETIVGVKKTENLTAKVSYSDDAVHRVVRRVLKGTEDKPVNAHISFTPENGFKLQDSKDGVTIDSDHLEQEIRTALASPGKSRDFKPQAKIEPASVHLSALAKKYPTVVVVDRKKYKLTLYKNLKVAQTYGVAVGQAGLETPAGQYQIHNKEINPTWHVPDSKWAGKLAGKVIPPGPDNPLVARWLGIQDGIGIHGTNESNSIGSSASHGCIRMRPADVIKLYPEVPIGATVYIS